MYMKNYISTLTTHLPHSGTHFNLTFDLTFTILKIKIRVKILELKVLKVRNGFKDARIIKLLKIHSR